MSGKNKLPYYKRYPRDFFEGTLGMSFELKAAYGLVLDLIYIHGTKLPDDQRFIAGQLNVSVRKWNYIRSELIRTDKIQLISGFISNYRAVIELESLGKYQEKQSENATKHNDNKDLRKPAHKPKYSQPEPEPEPLKTDPKVSVSKPAKRKSQMPENAVISDKMIEYATSPTRRHSKQEAEAQFNKFKNNALAKGLMFLNWDRAFLTWLDSDYFSPILSKGNSNGTRTNDEQAARNQTDAFIDQNAIATRIAIARRQGGN